MNNKDNHQQNKQVAKPMKIKTIISRKTTYTTNEHGSIYKVLLSSGVW